MDQHLKREVAVKKLCELQRMFRGLEEEYERSPRRSAMRHATTLGITPRYVQRILHNDLHYHPYKIQIVQALNTRDYGARVCFCQEMLDLIGEDEDLANNIG